MTEAEARALLEDCDGQGGIERWIAGRPWQAIPGGWSVAGDLRGWRHTLAAAAEEVRVTADPGGGLRPAEWTVAPRTRP